MYKPLKQRSVSQPFSKSNHSTNRLSISEKKKKGVFKNYHESSMRLKRLLTFSTRESGKSHLRNQRLLNIFISINLPRLFPRSCNFYLIISIFTMYQCLNQGFAQYLTMYTRVYNGLNERYISWETLIIAEDLKNREEQRKLRFCIYFVARVLN